MGKSQWIYLQPADEFIPADEMLIYTEICSTHNVL